MKESIKNILLAGGSISLPYKTEINEWYGSLRINKLSDGGYVVEPGWENFSDIDDAINFFLHKGYTSNNVGYIQDRLRNKGINFDRDYNLEKPDSKLKKLFKDEAKLVDEESKLLDIKIKEIPKLEVAFNEIDELVLKLNIDNIKDILHDFENKYKRLDPYISLEFVYDNNGREFTSGIKYKNLSKKVYDDYTTNKKELKYKSLSLTFKLRGTDEYKRYRLSF